MKILLISRNSSHAKYYEKLVKKCQLDARLHITGRPRLGALSRFNYLSNFDMEALIQTHLLRKKARHNVLFSNLIISKLFSLWLRFIESLRYMKFIDLLLCEKPDKVIVWNGKKLPNQTVAIAANSLGIPVMYFENGLVPNTTCLDPKGVNFTSSLPRNPNFYLSRALSGQALAQIEQVKSHKKRSIDNETLNLPEKYIFVPFQVPNDTQVVVHSPWIKSMEALFSAVMYAIDNVADKEIKVVFKEHPNWPKKFTHLHSAHGRALFANGTKATTLIENAVATITINSTVGLEALQLGGKLITLGEACYALDGMTLKANSQTHLIEQINNLSSWQPNTQLITAFLDYVNSVYAIPNAWRRADTSHFKAIESRILGTDTFSSEINVSHTVATSVVAEVVY